MDKTQRGKQILQFRRIFPQEALMVEVDKNSPHLPSAQLTGFWFLFPVFFVCVPCFAATFSHTLPPPLFPPRHRGEPPLTPTNGIHTAPLRTSVLFCYCFIPVFRPLVGRSEHVRLLLPSSVTFSLSLSLSLFLCFLSFIAFC